MGSSVTVTFAFTDLVGSTATAARLGPTAAEELRQTHFGLLRTACTAAGGTEVKNLGDGLMIAFLSPSRAIAGAVGMQQAIERHNRSGREPLAVRIGMSTGEAIEEDGDYFGDPVVEAARLCSSATGGQILVADVLRLLVGRNSTHTFRDVGSLELKGIPDPVRVAEVLWEPAAVEGSLPLPGRLVGAATDALFGFFGRSREVAALEHVCKEAHESTRARLALISGEAGMGKTSLAAQFARRAHSDGVSVLFGHADEDIGISYQPWIEALTALVRNGGPDLIAGLRPVQRSALARLVPDIVPDDDSVTGPEMERLLVFEATTELLAAVSRGAPVIIVFDDVHWADTSSLQLLRHVVASPTPMDLTIVCTYRDTDLRRGDDLTGFLADLHRQATVTRISLTGLGDDDLAELMAAAAGHELDDDGFGLAHALRRETEGNPFFTTELLRHLGETGGIVQGDDGRWALAGDLESLGLPSSVRDVVGRRVDRLGDEALRVLCLAAVIGREFDVDTLGSLADVDDGPLLDLLDTAVTAALLVETDVVDRYRFTHALIQHSLYDELSPARRQRAHQRVGELLEAAPHDGDATWLAELAHHWVAATRPSDLDKALGYVRRAGDASRDALAPDDAVRWYEQALDLAARQSPPDDRVRAEILAALGTARYRAGRPDFREPLREAAGLAERLGDTRLLVQAALGFCQWRGSQVGSDDAKAVIPVALAHLDSESTSERARLLAGLAIAHDAGVEHEARRRLALEAVDAARRAGDGATFAEVMDITYVALGTPSDRDRTIDDLERAMSIVESSGDPLLLARIAYAMSWVRYQQADLAGVDDVQQRLASLVDEIGLPHLRWLNQQLHTGRLLVAGRYEAAEESNDQTLEFGTTADIADAFGMHVGILFGIRWEQGRVDEIGEFFIDVARDSLDIPALRALVPKLLCALGRHDEARTKLAAEADLGFDFPLDGLWLSAMTNLADATADLGDERSARMLLGLFGAHADHVVSPVGITCDGAAARTLARLATLLGDHDRAELWFQLAHDLNARLGTPFWTAVAQLDHADLCLARREAGDVERARDMVGAARASGAEHGNASVLSRSEVLLARL